MSACQVYSVPSTRIRFQECEEFIWNPVFGSQLGLFCSHSAQERCIRFQTLVFGSFYVWGCVSYWIRLQRLLIRFLWSISFEAWWWRCRRHVGRSYRCHVRRSYRRDVRWWTPKLVRSPSLLQRLQSINLSRLYRSESIQGDNPSGGSGKAEMRKSASKRRGSIEHEEEEEVERRRPQTVRVEATSCREDEEVDAKADDFINKFKKQLRLQRIDSLLRYRASN
ncbi:uncharacterized protein LOC128194753 [Vigna angularis]|uniref:uncharacterized protein LOC128194753 n=1 Tax=Phaseolus angularis TaxID=3914 RepID=UPI0022B4BDE5|nr:uncharacterized protein LOC128194753 [Vigna angularis]